MCRKSLDSDFALTDCQIATGKFDITGTVSKQCEFNYEVPLGEEVSLPLPSNYSEAISGTEIARKVEHKAGRQKKFVVAIDASLGNDSAKQALLSTLKKASTNICRVIIARPVEGVKEYAASDAHAALGELRFKGCDDNWALLERAIRTARTAQADVLGVHGAKPWAKVGGSNSNNTWVGSIGYGVKCPADLAALCGGAVEIHDLQTERGGNEVLERTQASAGDTTPFSRR